ncbi:hypothetical protein Lal_00024228 [Lupinus albus]|nr:hypothetical protein Lal_00024228 [Lupinus albus]
MKINIDGAAHGAPGAPGLTGGGCIFRDNTGSFRGGFAVFFGILDSMMVELQAALMDIEIAYRNGLKDIWLECDSMLVVDIFNGKGNIPWKLANKWHTCLEWISSLTFKATHIYRECNTCADKLAAFVVSSKVFTWWNSTPRFILEELNKNRLGMPNYRCNFL